MAVIIDAITTILYTAMDVLPIVLFIFGFQVLVLRKPLPHFKRLLAGLGFVILGLGLFLIGLEMALQNDTATVGINGEYGIHTSQRPEQ